MRAHLICLFLSALLLALSGCSDAASMGAPMTPPLDTQGSEVAQPRDTDAQGLLDMRAPEDTAEPAPAVSCAPSRNAYERNARPIFESKCGTCHGDEPDFGAPFSLLSYDALLEGPEGARIVDRIITALVTEAMPPPGMARPSHAEFDTLIGWASCGRQHPAFGEGLVASRPVFEAPDEGPPNLEVVDLTASAFPIGLDTIDHYENFVFSDIVDRDRFIRRFEIVLDESRVVHHVTLHRSLGGDRYLYAWAPGGNAFEFDDGGLRIRPNDRLRVEIHYNNGAGLEDVTDSSGVRLYLDEPVGTEYAMLNPSTWSIFVPGHGTASENSLCQVNNDFHILAAAPHMHEIGSEFRHVVRREEGGEETLIDLTGWSFELQYFYEVRVDVREGDSLWMTCTYENPTGDPVGAGLGTKDEMCFDFLYVTPPNASISCSF